MFVKMLTFLTFFQLAYALAFSGWVSCGGHLLWYCFNCVVVLGKGENEKFYTKLWLECSQCESVFACAPCV